MIITISDTGRGMSAERMENLFDVGFSQKGSRMRMNTGLASCYGVVQRHKGRIEVESEPGKGTTFRVALPVKQA